jgi:hypothetical protein
MQIEYWINDNSTWRQVTWEEYDKFEGQKEQRPSNWRLSLLQAILQPYRYL